MIHLTNCGDELPSLTVLPTILHDPALQVYRLPGWLWQLDPSRIFEHPSDFLKVLPGSLARDSWTPPAHRVGLEVLWE
jgi:hypothetical protein